MTMTSKKKQRQEKAIKRKNIKTAITIIVSVLIVGGIIALLTLNSPNKGDGRIFTDGPQRVVLNNDNTFSAVLAHNQRYNGTYTESPQGGSTTVVFTYSGRSANGSIQGDVLTLPHEWDDGHGHGGALRLRK